MLNENKHSFSQVQYFMFENSVKIVFALTVPGFGVILKTAMGKMEVLEGVKPIRFADAAVAVHDDYNEK